MITDHGKTIHLRRRFRVGVAELYAAWSNPAVFRAWWKDLSVAEMDFREGGKYRLEWENEPETATVGEYREIVPNERIVMGWVGSSCSDGGGERTDGSVVTLRFRALGPDESVLELRHELLPAGAMDDHHWGWTHAMLELDRHANAPRRANREELRAEVSRVVAAPLERVWEAWTKAEWLARWFNRAGATAGTAKVDLRVGGKFFMDYQTREGDLHRIHGQYGEIVPRERLVFEWVDDNAREETLLDKGTESRVTVTFKQVPGGTELRVVHDRLAAGDAMEVFRSGWTDCLRSIEEELRAF